MNRAKELLKIAINSYREDRLENFRVAIEQLAADNRWKELTDDVGRPLRCFQQVITIDQPEGLGMKVDRVRAIWNAAWPEKADWFRELTLAPQGMRTDLVDNINEVGRSAGTSRDYTLSRLRRERPDLAAKVDAEEISANAAAIEAGFRKKPTPLDELRRAWNKASKAEKDTFRSEIQ